MRLHNLGAQIKDESSAAEFLKVVYKAMSRKNHATKTREESDEVVVIFEDVLSQIEARLLVWAAQP